jgi:hypothetical protein
MTDVRPSAIVSVAALVARIDACSLCGVGPERLGNAVLVRNASGAAIEFTVCDRCVAAVRRLIAAAGGAGASGPARMGFEPEPAVTLVADVTRDSATHDTVGEPQLIYEFAEPFVGADGLSYLVRVWGQGRADQTWIGWLTFVSTDGSLIRRTPRETSQSSRDHLAYWATGLQGSYVQGAFGRAT